MGFWKRIGLARFPDAWAGMGPAEDAERTAVKMALLGIVLAALLAGAIMGIDAAMTKDDTEAAGVAAENGTLPLALVVAAATAFIPAIRPFHHVTTTAAVGLVVLFPFLHPDPPFWMLIPGLVLAVLVPWFRMDAGQRLVLMFLTWPTLIQAAYFVELGDGNPAIAAGALGSHLLMVWFLQPTTGPWRKAHVSILAVAAASIAVLAMVAMSLQPEWDRAVAIPAGIMLAWVFLGLFSWHRTHAASLPNIPVPRIRARSSKTGA